jgi:hypothetical protein
MNSQQRVSALRRLGHQLLKDWTRNDDIDIFASARAAISAIVAASNPRSWNTAPAA